MINWKPASEPPRGAFPTCRVVINGDVLLGMYFRGQKKPWFVQSRKRSYTSIDGWCELDDLNLPEIPNATVTALPTSSREP
jgi:hypothetical protein